MRYRGSGRLAQALASTETSVMSLDPFIATGSLLLLLGAALSFVAVYVSRHAVQRERAAGGGFRITRAGFLFYVVQTIGAFALVGWGFFHPDALIGRLASHYAGVVTLIALVFVVCIPIAVVLQGCGITLYQKRPGGG